MNLKKCKFGYEITDIDYNNVDTDSILQAVGNGRFVIIRNNQPVEPSTLVDFYKKLGTVAKQNEKVQSAGVNGIRELVKVRADGMFSGNDDGELEYHCAGMNRDGAENIVAMYMHEPAKSGGATYYTDSQTAFQDMPDRLKNICRGLRSKIVTYSAKAKLEGSYYKKIFTSEQDMMEFRDPDGKPVFNKQTPRKDLVVRHPITGSEGLYFPWSVIRGFTGITVDEQKRLYTFLKKHTLSDKYVYKHEWQDYDILLSDQTHSLHRRDAYEGERELWRAGIWLQGELDD
jgi:alpha-ketoglutarate-dependent taurine dioxygenase